MKKKKLPFTLMLAALACMTSAGTTFADERTWTLDADFDQGTIVNLNHSPNHDQLQLNNEVKPFPFINIPASSRGTVVRVNTDTGEIVGEYRTAPEGRGLSPSRTTVDIRGNVWTGNRGEAGDNKGSAVKIGIVVGGTRCNKDGSLNPDGDYVKLEPNKLTYNTCIDRNHDGLIRTSKGLGDYLRWEDKGDGQGGAGGGDARVEDAEDECILIYQRLPDAHNTRHISVDRENNVWAAGYSSDDLPRTFHKMVEETGAIIQSFSARDIGCGGYGGTILDNNFDQILGNDILWSSSVAQGKLLRYDLSTGTGQCIDVALSYGIGIDNDGFIWNNMANENTITKINPNTAQQVSGFPVPTGGLVGRGVAVTADNTVWSANSNEKGWSERGEDGTVSRLDTNGNILAIIPVGKAPTGLSVDAAGKVWVTNRESNNAMRINPATNAVDLTVDLGGAGAVGGPAGPYNYSDMTGSVRLSHPPIGFWDVVYDSGCNTLWDRISWSSDENPATNSAIKVEIRVAATKAGLAAEPFRTVTNGENLTGMKGQFMEVRASFISEAPAGQRSLPVLKDLTVAHHRLDMTVNIPDQKYSFGFAPFDLDDYITFNPAGDWFNDVVWSHSPLPAGWSVNIDANHVATVTGPPNETRDVPITFSPRLAWSSEQCTAEGDQVTFFANHPPVPCPDAPPFQCLWSPNHKGYTPVPLTTGYACDPDGDALNIRITSITSDEPTKKNNGDDAPDADPNCIGTDTAQLRPEREGKGDGRVYMVTFVASDGRGGETTMTLPVRVPHNQTGCEAVDSGQNYDATVPSPAPAKSKGTK